MKRHLVAISSLVLAAFFGASAHAADLRGSTKDTPVDGVSVDKPVNWSSIYVGGQIGVTNGNHKLSDQEYKGVCKPATGTGPGNITPTAANQTDQQACLAHTGQTWVDTAIDGASAFLDGVDSHGIFGGGRLGADLQRGNFVFGVFGDYNFSNAKATAGLGKDFFGGAPASIEDGDSWLIAARAGILLGSEKRTLVYGLAGYEQQDVSYHLASAGSDPFNKDVTFGGLVAGAGIEHALNNLVSIGIEYQHFFGGTENVFDGRGTEQFCPQSVINDKMQSDKIMGRVNFHVGPGLFGY